MPTIPTKRFIVLIGGPCRFVHYDKAHDQTWHNYIVPNQLAAQRGLYQRQDNEVIYWLVYEPPYRSRWLDDSVITGEEKKQDDGSYLHSVRKAAADKVRMKGAMDYISRIRQIAAQHKIKYKGISSQEQFWDFIAECPKASISRVWYSGHASKFGGLMLSLYHDSNGAPSAASKDRIILHSRARSLADRFDTKTKMVSRFYGCFTDLLAKEWNITFNVPTAGARNGVYFGCIDQSSHIANILTRLEQTPPPSSGKSPEWRHNP